MWSTIGSVSARQIRLAGARNTGRVVARLSRQPSATPIAFRASLSRGHNVTFCRGLATTKTPKKATTTKKPAAKKPAKKPAKKKPVVKKKAPVKKKPTGRPKKPLTDEQKAKLRIRELKARSLVSEEPKRLAVTPFSLYFSDYAKEKRGQGIPIQDILREAGANFKAFTPAQLEPYVEVSDKNKAINTTTIRTFVLSKSVEEIAVANRARKELRALGFKAPVLPDERRPKGPLNTFAMYVAEYWKKENPTGVAAAEVVKRAASEWKSLSDSDRQLFEQRAAVDKERYVQEREAIGWTVKSSTKNP